MKNIIKLAFLSTLLSTNFSVFAANGPSDAQTQNISQSKSKLSDTSIVAELDGQKITLKDVLGQYKEAFENQPALKGKKFEDLDKSIQENIIKGYVHAKVIEKEAVNAKIQDSEEFRKKLESIKPQIAQQLLIDNILKEKVTDSTLKSEYESIKKESEGKQEAKASHILVADEKTAKEVKEKLDKGEKFTDLAKKYSTDEGSKANGGELGYFMKGQLVPEFEAQVFSMKKGAVSQPVKTQFGYHIIKLEDVRPLKVPSFEEVKPSIENKLSREAVESYVNTLVMKYKVKFEI